MVFTFISRRYSLLSSADRLSVIGPVTPQLLGLQLAAQRRVNGFLVTKFAKKLELVFDHLNIL